MFCHNCGTKLPDEAELCPACGESVAIVTPAAEPPVTEDTVPLETLLADVKESFQLEETAEAEEAPEEVEEESTYAAPEQEEEPEAPRKKKSRKALRIIIPILAVLLLLAAAAGFLYLANETYAKAVECLAVKDYEQAQELFGRFSIFEEFKVQEERLISLQEAYDKAGQMVENNNYQDALQGYAALGDYRDSQYLFSAEVPYKQATYLMERAAEQDIAALAQIPGYDPASTEQADVLLYKGAAELFASLGDFQDAAIQSSASYVRLASVYMIAGRFEEALACHELMNETDKELSVAEYLTYCDDEALLQDMDKAIRARYALENSEEASLDRDLVQAELDILSQYADKELMFYDTSLQGLLDDYLKALETEMSAVDEAGNCANLIAWYTGNAARYSVVETLIDAYDLLGDDAALQISFAGKSAYYQAAATIETALTEQLLGVAGVNDKKAGDHLVFENTTGYLFSLSVRNEFFNEEGESIFLHQSEPIPVDVDATVQIPLLFPEDGEWTKWTTAWEYDIQLAC